MGQTYTSHDTTAGVTGINDNATPDAGPGVLGQSAAVGVLGNSTTWHGVAGLSESTTGGFGVYGKNTQGGAGVVGESDGWMGVYGKSGSTTGGAGVMGEGDPAPGVIGKSTKWIGVYGETAGIENGPAGVWGEHKGAGVGVKAISKDGIGLAAFSATSEAVHAETQATGFAAAVAGIAINQDGIAPGVLGQSNGEGPGIVGKAIRDAGVIGFHGDPRLQETTVSNDGGRAGVFGASANGAGVLGYSADKGSPAVYAFGGLRAIALDKPLAAWFTGNVQVDGDIFLPGADCAEQFDISAGGEAEPGTVVVIDENGSLRASQEAYDRKVAGVVSGAGQYKPGIILDKRNGEENRRPIALVGRVCCKVDAQYGAIEVGDLLTSSPTLGHAMKAQDPSKAFGAVIGKALGNLPAGKGLLPILVCLQ
jgi:hypothetical protein